MHDPQVEKLLSDATQATLGWDLVQAYSEALDSTEQAVAACRAAFKAMRRDPQVDMSAFPESDADDFIWRAVLDAEKLVREVTCRVHAYHAANRHGVGQ